MTARFSKMPCSLRVGAETSICCNRVERLVTKIGDEIL